MTGPLTPDGKPMRALRALASSENYLYEEQVWASAKRDAFDTASWHKALATLVERGLAIRHGHQGGYQWAITAAGRRAVEL